MQAYSPYCSGLLASCLALVLTATPGSVWGETVTFELEVPYCTPGDETVFLRSNRISAGEFLHDAMTQLGPTRWSGTFEVSTDLGVFTYKYSHLKVVKAASPVLLRIIILGAFFIYSTV